MLTTVAQFSIDMIGKGLGAFVAVIGIGKILYEINNIYNHLLTTDKIVQSQLERLDEKVQCIDDELKNAQFENREARARILDRLLVVEQRMYRQAWDKYVQRGILSEEQLQQIRKVDQKDQTIE